MKLIRNGAFETNSSSCHSVTVNDTGVYEGIVPSDDGTIYLTPHGFGWEQETYVDSMTKMAYVWIDIAHDPAKMERFRRVVYAHTGATDVVMQPTSECIYTYGYIDHQSKGVTDNLFCSDHTLKVFLFSPNSTLVTDNDNHD